MLYFDLGLYFLEIKLFVCSTDAGGAIQCYQCDSNEDMSCPSHKSFDLYLNAQVDCNSFEADVPGIFCMKITQQSPGCKYDIAFALHLLPSV